LRSAPVMLLHCWPSQRQAAYLAAVFEQVYLDVGLTHVRRPRRQHELVEVRLVLGWLRVVSEGVPTYGVELAPPEGKVSLCLYQTEEKPAQTWGTFRCARPRCLTANQPVFVRAKACA